jgi:hypothetical protein
MTATTISNGSALWSGTNITFSGTYTATFSPTAVKLGVEYLATLVVRYSSMGDGAKLRMALPNITATSLSVTAPFTATIAQISLTPSGGYSVESSSIKIKAQPNCELFVELVLDLQNSSESFVGVNISTQAVVSPSVPEPPGVDTTDDLKGTITAGSEKAPDEGKEKAFDNQPGSKWLAFDAQTWIQYSYAAGVAGRLTSYTLTSGGDAPERDPADFVLMGSNDGGKSWTIVDKRTGISFSARQQKQKFTLNTPTTCKTFRLSISRVAGGSTGLMQISEIELLGQQVQSP